MSTDEIGRDTRESGRVFGKRVLVTGAARGMGRSHAVRLAEEGADIILIDICESLPEIEYPLATVEDLEETARLVRKHDRSAITRVVDVRDAAALSAAVDDGVAELGGLDAAVANAGVLTVGTWLRRNGRWSRCPSSGGRWLMSTSSVAGTPAPPQSRISWTPEAASSLLVRRPD